MSLYRFKFAGNYHDATANYSGNALTGVPEQVIVSSVQVKFPQSVNVFIQHNYTSKIPLTDGNTAFAPEYNLLQAKIAWMHRFTKKSNIEIFAAAENLLNQKYSLGDDLNAIGGRYYNAAAPRNYNMGFNVRF